MGLDIETYSYRGLIDYSQTREVASHKMNSARNGTQSFTQTESFEEAIDFAVNGWDLGLEQYKIQDGILTNGTTHLNPSLSGCMPHVQNYIMGFPQQMYDLYDEREYNLPTLDIIVPLSYAGIVEGSDALIFSKSLVAYINKKASTRNIRLTGVFASKQGKTDSFQFITLKDFDEAMVINNLAFAFHPSFFRRIWFSVMESKDYLNWGYGKSILGKEYLNIVKENIDSTKSDEVIYFKSLQDLNTFSWEEKDLENFTM